MAVPVLPLTFLLVAPRNEARNSFFKTSLNPMGGWGLVLNVLAPRGFFTLEKTDFLVTHNLEGPTRGPV